MAGVLALSAAAGAAAESRSAPPTPHALLERLCDDFGGRLTGSVANAAALDRLAAELRALGLQPEKIPFAMLGWERGADRVELVAPLARALRVASLGYTQSHAAFEAAVVDLGNGRDADLPPATTAALAGRIGLLAATSPLQASEIVALAMSRGLRGVLFANREGGGQLLARTGSFSGAPLPVPLYSIAQEEGRWLQRLLARGEAVRVRLETKSRCRPIETANLAVRFPGKVASRLIVGAHFDSWDLGQGAMDNGLGIAQLFALATALRGRALHHTVELVWFNGEEQGLFGSRHAAAQLGDTPVVAMLNLDMVGVPIGVNALGDESLVPALERWHAARPAAQRLAKGVENLNWVASDHTPFQLAGVRALTFDAPIPRESVRYYHDFADTIDKVSPQLVDDSAAVIRDVVLAIADDASLGAWRRGPAETEALFTRFGLEKRLRALGLWPAQTPAAPKPDILLLMPDQYRGDCLSALGHPVVRTPTFDALAAEGTLFRRGYSTVPSCIPARFALLTGQQPQTSGIVGYASRPIAVTTLPGALVAAGYSAVMVGRNMHQSPESGALGYEKQILGSTYVPDDDYDRALKAAAPESGGIRAIMAALGVDANRWPAKAWPLAEELHPTAWVVRRARDVVAESRREKPLFLTASFYAPHPPLFPPARFFEKYLNAKLPAAAMGAWVDRGTLRPEGDKQGARILLQGEILRRAQAGYFGLIEHLDEQVAPLVAEFKARSEKAGRPWIVVVTSDHGEMLGDHGYFRKCEPYEGSANIPFIVAASPALGLRRGLCSLQPAGLEDIMPTLLELAAVARPSSVDGYSLAATLRDPSARGREWLHFEHAPIYSPEQGFHALTDGRHKYIWRPTNGAEQLFDLAVDPHEERDLSTVPAERAALERWRALLVQRLAGRPEGFSDGARLAAGRPYPRIHKK